MKFLVVIVVAIGLLSPLCQCGAVATEVHASTAAPCHDHHDHSHEDGGAPDGPADPHSHPHPDSRVSGNGTVVPPPVAVLDIAPWDRLAVPRPAALLDGPRPRPVPERLALRPRPPAPPVTGVFLL